MACKIFSKQSLRRIKISTNCFNFSDDDSMTTFSFYLRSLSYSPSLSILIFVLREAVQYIPRLAYTRNSIEKGFRFYKYDFAQSYLSCNDNNKNNNTAQIKHYTSFEDVDYHLIKILPVTWV